MPADPERCCDLILKGGITSGVVYPAAIRRIAERFVLVGIGGTSAGAIAASIAAAAEFRRRTTGSFAGFERLDQVARELASPGTLAGLFQPDGGTRTLYRLALRLATGKLGLGTRLTLAWRLLFQRDRTFRTLVDNGFGLCSGLGNGSSGHGGAEPLTAWLARTLNEVAGLDSGRPLSFADLHDAPRPPWFEALTGGEGPSIDLRAITTCLTFGRPFEIPFSSDVFAFAPDEWRRLFPAEVVAATVAAAERIPSKLRARDGKLPLPRRELPVVVAARMSLSFPGLFSMVPLWTPNFSRAGQPLARVWFSDGGITSNFPVHRFDSLYPRWPTLAVNLQYTGESRLPARARLVRDGGLVFLPADRGEGVLDQWHDFAPGRSATGDLVGFAGAIFRAAQAWHDNAYLKLPGYRDRLAEIWLTPEEGGLNLAMPPEVIERLIARGAEAGELLAERFATASDSDPMSWTGHRWTRFRSAMAGLAQALAAFERASRAPLSGTPTLAELLADRRRPPCYEFDSENQALAARHATEDLLEVIRGLRGLAICPEPDDAPERPFCHGPRPRVEIGSRAPF